MATRPGTTPNPRVAARVPVNTPESSMFGANQTVKFLQLAPYRPSSGMGNIPAVSVVRSPWRTGRAPSKTLSADAG